MPSAKSLQLAREALTGYKLGGYSIDELEHKRHDLLHRVAGLLDRALSEEQGVNERDILGALKVLEQAGIKCHYDDPKDGRPSLAWLISQALRECERETLEHASTHVEQMYPTNETGNRWAALIAVELRALAQAEPDAKATSKPR